MAEEQNPQSNAGVSTTVTATPNENKVEVDRAELEALKSSQARMTKLDEIASEAQLDNVEDYLDGLEGQVYKQEDPPDKPPEPAKPRVDPPAPSSGTSAPATAELSEADRKLLNDLKQQTNANMIATQRQEWEAEQRALPEDQRSAATAEDLLKILYSKKGAVIGQSAGAFSGNIFKAAAYAYGIEHGNKEAFKAGAESATALANAAVSANLETSGKTAVPDKLTPVERREAWQKEQADDIEPDDAPIE